MATRVSALGTLVAIFVFAIAGCGQSEDEATKSGAAKAAYVARADMICTRQNNTIRDVGSPAHVRNVVAPHLLKEFQELKSLRAPKGEAAKAREFLDALRLIARRAEYNPSYFAKSTRPFLRTELIGAHLGFKVCGRV